MLVHTLFSKIPTGVTTCNKVTKVCSPVLGWRFGWNTVFAYLTNRYVIQGVEMTLFVTAMAMIIGFSLGLVIAIMRMSSNRLLTSLAWLYTWFFRGTPVYVQLLFWYNIAVLYQSFTLGIPFSHLWIFYKISSNSLFTVVRAAIFAFGSNEAAYFSEIARGGLMAVDEGQLEAAKSIGMTRSQSLRFIIIPQAMRVIIPPSGNEVISMLKTTSIAVAIGLPELTYQTENIAARTYQVMPLLIVASLWYLAITTILSIGQFYVERHYAKGALRTLPPTPLQRLRADMVWLQRRAAR
jgi:polar amino acid transport system permease protein